MASEPKEKTPIPGETAEKQKKSVPTAPNPIADWITNRVQVGAKGTTFVLGDWDPEGFNSIWGHHVQAVYLKSTHFSAIEGMVEHEEHEKTREFVAEKLADLAKKQDIIETKEEIITALKNQIADLEERLEATAAKLVKTEELEAATSRVCEEVKLRSEETCRQMSEQLADLRRYLSKFVPHKRFFKVTFGFLCFFSVAVFVDKVFGVRIIEPFWGAIGIALTAAMLVVIYFGMKDAQESVDRAEKS